jgi:hypothetical protein
VDKKVEQQAPPLEDPPPEEAAQEKPEPEKIEPPAPKRLSPEKAVLQMDVPEVIARAHAHCKKSEFVDGLALIDALNKKGGLGRDALRNAWVARGHCLAKSGEGIGAERAFATALHLDPEYRLNAEIQQEVPGAYFAALALLPPGRTILQTRVQWRGGDPQKGIAVHLIRDRLRLAQAVALVDGNDEILHQVPIAPERTVFVPPQKESPGQFIRLKLIDAHGNEVRSLPPPSAPTRMVVGQRIGDPPSDERDWLTLLGAGILVGGAVAAAGTGLFAVVGGGGNLGPAFEDSAGYAMWGALAFTGAILVGAGILGYQALSRQADPQKKDDTTAQGKEASTQKGKTGS